jgi:p-aminobenzoyl-glutamate transporter AbgT
MRLSLGWSSTKGDIAAYLTGFGAPEGKRGDFGRGSGHAAAVSTPPATDELPRPRKGALARALGAIERAGDRLPGPIVLLLLLWGLVLIASFVAGRRGVSATHPGTGANIAAVSLLSREGVRRMLADAPRNFVLLPQVGPVLVMLLGVGVAERSGVLRAVFARLGRRAPPKALTAGVVLAGILSSAFGDLGLIVMPALGACLFLASGRHPSKEFSQQVWSVRANGTGAAALMVSRNQPGLLSSVRCANATWPRQLRLPRFQDAQDDAEPKPCHCGHRRPKYCRPAGTRGS